ncbi:MAG: cupin domain-containing protein [Anaerolineae bacterium]|jgi:quercetin dioxygenase-like cupin family protein|nr:cupin domain-containing protein [Anaerolineae bacterium]
MAVVHRHTGQLEWEGVPVGRYPPSKEMQGVSVRWLIGPQEKAPTFALRYFEIEPGGWTSLDRHAHEHGVFILKGRGQVRIEEEWFEVEFGDVIYIPPNEVHQLRSLGDEPLGFLCVIPARERAE